MIDIKYLLLQYQFYFYISILIQLLVFYLHCTYYRIKYSKIILIFTSRWSTSTLFNYYYNYSCRYYSVNLIISDVVKKNLSFLLKSPNFRTRSPNNEKRRAQTLSWERSFDPRDILDRESRLRAKEDDESSVRWRNKKKKRRKRERERARRTCNVP